MAHLWWVASRCTHYSDDIQAEFAVDTSGLDIVVDGLTQVLKFLIIDSIFWFSEHAVTAGFHLDKNQYIVICCDDIKIPMSRLPVAFQDGIALMLKIFSCQFLTPHSKLIMCCHSLMYFAFRLQKYDIFPISRHPFGFFISLVLH